MLQVEVRTTILLLRYGAVAMRLLLLEDNPRCADLVCEHLNNSGYLVDQAQSINEFHDVAADGGHLLYIVDLCLPDGDAIDLIRDLRGAQNHVPILVASGRAQTRDRIAGLEVGADDYLVKPYNCLELIARVRALLRRPKLLEARSVTVGALGLDTVTGAITHNRELFDLTSSERRLLAILMKRRNQVVAKEVLEHVIFNDRSENSPKALEKLISRLRKRIGEAMGVEVRTVRGDGYRLVERP